LVQKGGRYRCAQHPTNLRSVPGPFLNHARKHHPAVGRIDSIGWASSRENPGCASDSPVSAFAGPWKGAGRHSFVPKGGVRASAERQLPPRMGCTRDPWGYMCRGFRKYIFAASRGRMPWRAACQARKARRGRSNLRRTEFVANLSWAKCRHSTYRKENSP